MELKTVEVDYTLDTNFTEIVPISHPVYRKESFIKKLNHTMYLAIKRLLDIAVAVIGCIAIIPLAMFIKLTYILTGDFDSIFYKQKRIGKDGKKIYIFKFRTMIHNAEEELNKLLQIEKYRKEWEKNNKLEDDPRITKIGKILRKTSLDEVPQFINVLKGDMTLIGPRPLVEGELDAHNGNHEIYEKVKPRN